MVRNVKRLFIRDGTQTGMLRSEADPDACCPPSAYVMHRSHEGPYCE